MLRIQFKRLEDLERFEGDILYGMDVNGCFIRKDTLTIDFLPDEAQIGTVVGLILMGYFAKDYQYQLNGVA